MSPPVRVLLVDDSALTRLALRRFLAEDPEIMIVGESTNGQEALDRVASALPDIILMDIVMPVMNGLDATRQLMSIHPTPVLIISDQIGGNADLSFDALRAGAIDVIGKPSAEQLADVKYTKALRRKIRVLAGVPVITRHRRAPRSIQNHAPPQRDRPSKDEVSLVLVGASTGGPPALLRLINALPHPPAWPMVIVQHIAQGFSQGLVSWLRHTTGRDVQLVEQDMRACSSTIYVANDGAHLELSRQRLLISDGPPLGGHRPSVDTLFTSVASQGTARHTVAALLTGMGRDGAHGLGLLRNAGAWTIAQDQATSVVFGMPKEAAENGAACEVLPIDEIAGYLASIA